MLLFNLCIVSYIIITFTNVICVCKKLLIFDFFKLPMSELGSNHKKKQIGKSDKML